MPRLITQTVVADFRDRLCDVAAALYAEQGRDGFNMRELAKRLRVSPMTAYRYFQDKEEILAALRARAFARFADLLETVAAAPARQRNAALAQTYGHFARQEEASYRLMFDLFQPRCPTVPELGVEERRARDALARYARRMVEDGLFDGDPDMMGQIFWSALHGATALHLASKLPASELDRVLAETVRVLAGAYRGGNAAPTDEWPALAPLQTQAASGYSALAALPAAE